MDKIWIKDGNFVELSKEQKESLSDAEVVQYYADKTENTLKSVLVANEKEIKEIAEKVNQLNDNFQNMKIKEIEANVEGLQRYVKNIKTSEPQHEAPSLEKAISENFSKIKSLKKGDKMEFVVKTDVTRSLITNNTAAYRLPNIGQLANPLPALYEAFNKIPVSSVEGKNTIRYWDTTSVTRNAASITENDVYPESAIAWQEYSLALEKYGDSIPITYEMMQDFPRFMTEVQRFLEINVMRDLNADLWSGNGTTPNIKGIYTYASAFNHAGYAGTTFVDGNIIDLLDVLKTQIMSGYDDKYYPTTAFVSHNDYLKYINHKNANGEYIFKNAAIPYNIVKSSYVTDNTMLLGDMRFADLYMLDNITLEIGETGNDFTYDRKTLKARTRCGLLIRNADLGGFLKVTDVAAAIAAITT